MYAYACAFVDEDDAAEQLPWSSQVSPAAQLQETRLRLQEREHR